MRYSSWHGSEDFPGPVPVDDFDAWENDMGWNTPPWNGWDVFVRRMLMAGGAAAVWAAFIILAIIAIKGDL